MRKLKDPCRTCGRPLDPSWKICPFCESEVGSAAPAPRRTRRRRETAVAERAVVAERREPAPVPAERASVRDRRDAAITDGRDPAEKPATPRTQLT
jgi:predicted amidophosphoribosyltransferase